MKKPVNSLYMNLTSYSICKKSLDFQPDTPWPKNWPAFAWKKMLISGFNRKHQPVLNFNSEDVKFLHLFQSCYPTLNISELSRIILNWKSIQNPVFSWKDFFSLYNLQDTDFIIQLLNAFASIPSSFQKWANKRGIHPAELRILNSLENPNQAQYVFQWIAEHNLSHSLGMKALELGVELLLMDVQIDKILHSNTSPEEILQIMEQHRKPLSVSSDQIKKRTLKKIIWPSHVNAQWQRKGDVSGLEIKIWCQNQKELEEKTNRIHRMKLFNKFDKQPEK